MKNFEAIGDGNYSSVVASEKTWTYYLQPAVINTRLEAIKVEDPLSHIYKNPPSGKIKFAIKMTTQNI